ncbi:MAG TPA: MFS transporter [Steroidobacteraceae bacterium]|nr:MFS transporter [Steroidobacteraceae bacterium]
MNSHDSAAAGKAAAGMVANHAHVRPRAQRWYVLGLLTLVYGLNIADRFSISTLIEPIRLELHLSDSGIAFLTGVALALFYVTIGIPIAVLADRANRRNILAISIAIWSAMTAFCGFTRNYTQLLLGRFGVGIGEAGGTPPSSSILADEFPPQRRPMALTIWALGACLGAWLGSSITGQIAAQFGWRAAFRALGIPGLIVALVLWMTVREPERGRFDQPGGADAAEPDADARAPAAPRASLWGTLGYLEQHRSALHLVLGGSVATLWSWGLIWWMPTFLQRCHHLTLEQAGNLLGPMHLIAGTAGTLMAGWLMTGRAASDPRHITRLLAWGLALSTIPSMALLWVDSTWAVTLLLWIFVPAVYFYIGPIMGLLQNVVPPHMRATTCALLLFTANVANLVIAPQVVGAFSDGFASAFNAGSESLRWAMLILAPTGFWAAWHLWAAEKTVIADEAAAR